MTERDRFEYAWREEYPLHESTIFRRSGLNPDAYVNTRVQDGWLMWQSCSAAHSAVAQEPVAYTSADRFKRIAERNRYSTVWPASMRDEGDIPLYAHPQPMPQTDAARDAEDAKRYRFIKSQMKVGAVQTQLPLYRTLHWTGYEDCSDVHSADAAIDAEIERLDRAKGE